MPLLASNASKACANTAVPLRNRAVHGADPVRTSETKNPKIKKMPLLTLEDVSHAYGYLPLLENVQLRVEPGERLALIGRNGTG
jgi:ABC-type molybdenum transport system ATPase subunit/photorepair protein PhrA